MRTPDADLTNLYTMRNPERSASASFPANEIWSAESKDPDTASCTIPCQGILLENSLIQHGLRTHPRDPSTPRPSSSRDRVRRGAPLRIAHRIKVHPIGFLVLPGRDTQKSHKLRAERGIPTR